MAEKTFHSITLPGQDTARVPLTAAEFSTSVAYKVKDYCTYQGKLYRCTTAHAAGAWNAAHFTETDVDAEFDRKLDIPASQASAPANPRVGDLWIDNDENSPIYNVDASPTLNSTNAVQSGGTKVALNSLDSRKMEHGVITGDFSASVDYRVGDLVFYATTANGITTRTLYRCTTDHDTAAWNPTHFTATTLEVELQRVRDSEADTDMIGDLFGAKTTYAVGDYCIYNDNLYRCIQAVDNTGATTPAFDPEDWTQVALANDVSDLNSASNALHNTLSEWRELSYSVVSGKLMNVNTRVEVTFATGAYFICTQPETCTKLKVTALAQGSDNLYPLLTFFNANDEIISKFGGISVQYTDEIVAIPSGTKYFICNYATQNGAIFSISGFYVLINETEQKNKIYYELDNNIIYVSTRYDSTSDFVVLLQKKGGNNLFDFGTFYLNQNTDIYPKSNLTGKTLLYETGSDYHGPMIVRTVNNMDGDNPYSQYWTGGNHQYNNTGVGSTPTARCVNVKFYIDGAELTSGDGYCSNIRITWTNYVQSYSTTKADGTGREVIKENHVLSFDGQKWNSYVELIALEDIIFQNYYGFQYGGIVSIYPNVRYIGAVNRLEYDAQESNTESGDKTCSMIKGYGTDHCIIMELDTNFDLGKREHYTGTRGALTQTYGKGYFYVIANETTSDANYRVNAGELIAMRGAYTFVPTLA